MTPLRTLTELAVGGNLDDWLGTRRAAGKSLRAIARELDHNHGINVTAETIRVWCASSPVCPVHEPADPDCADTFGVPCIGLGGAA